MDKSSFWPCTVRLPFWNLTCWTGGGGIFMDRRAHFVGALLRPSPSPLPGAEDPSSQAARTLTLTARADRAETVSRKTPTNIPLFGCFLVGGWVPDLFPVFPLMLLMIGFFPRSLACPIILWNIQGNVSSCCHSNYYNIPHGSWLSSFWKYFSFFFFFKLSSSHVRPVDFSRASVPSWPQRDIPLRRGSGGQEGCRWSELERSTQNVLNRILAPGTNCPTTVLGAATATRRPNYWLQNCDMSGHPSSPGIIFYHDRMLPSP